MSLIITAKTESRNGLPIRTLLKAIRNIGDYELIENISLTKTLETGDVYEITAHKSVNPELELKGN